MSQLFLGQDNAGARIRPTASGRFETVARRRYAALLSEFGLGHVREYAPFGLILSALHLILRAKSQHICFKCARMALRATFSFYTSEVPAESH